jgi:hypothetical protein
MAGADTRAARGQTLRLERALATAEHSDKREGESGRIRDGSELAH